MSTYYYLQSNISKFLSFQINYMYIKPYDVLYTHITDPTLFAPIKRRCDPSGHYNGSFHSAKTVWKITPINLIDGPRLSSAFRQRRAHARSWGPREPSTGRNGRVTSRAFGAFHDYVCNLFRMSVERRFWHLIPSRGKENNENVRGWGVVFQGSVRKNVDFLNVDYFSIIIKVIIHADCSNYLYDIIYLIALFCMCVCVW